jgi:predicted phage terminase large subunit-like protein
MKLGMLARRSSLVSTASRSTLQYAKSKLRLELNEKAANARAGGFNAWCREVTPEWQWDALHIEHIHWHLDRVTTGKIRKLMVNLPPRHSKTESITIRYSAYRLELDPTTTILIVGHTQGLATKFSRKVKKIVESRIALAKGKRSAAEWETAAGGGVKAVGVMGVGGGLGFDLIIGDDLIKSRKEANSPAYRDRIADAYKDDISTRLNPGGALIFPFTRWHLQDIGGYILGSEDGPNWKVIRLPALAQKDDPLHRPEGMALWPERWDRAYLEERKRVMGPSFFPLYQQEPQLGGGDMFKAFWFADAYVRAVPAGSRYLRYWDKASKGSGNGAETAGVLMAKTPDGEFIICDVVHGRWEPGERESIIKRTAQSDGFQTEIYIEQEPGSGGRESGLISVKNLAGYRVNLHPVSNEGDKVVRAEPLSAQAQAGNVKILIDTPIRRWNELLIQQFADFPQGNLKDIVDAASGALNKLTLKSSGGKPAVSGPRSGMEHAALEGYGEEAPIWQPRAIA